MMADANDLYLAFGQNLCGRESRPGGLMCFARPNTRDETPSRRHGAVTMADRQDVASKLALAFVLEAVKPIDSDTCDSMESDSDSCISDDTTDSIEQYQEHLIKSAFYI